MTEFSSIRWVYWNLNQDFTHTELDDLELLKLNGIVRWVSIPGVASIVYWVSRLVASRLLAAQSFKTQLDPLSPFPRVFRVTNLILERSRQEAFCEISSTWFFEIAH